MTLTLAFLLSIFSHHSAVQSKVRAVHSIYVEGDSGAYVEVMRRLSHGECFQVSSDPKAADAVLKITQRELDGELNGAEVTGRLFERGHANPIWMDTKQKSSLIKSGTWIASFALMESLSQAAGCGRYLGKRKDE
jgi:hypothetical protein